MDEKEEEKLTIHNTLIKGFHLRKTSSKWVPHAITEVEKWTGYTVCYLLLLLLFF